MISFVLLNLNLQSKLGVQIYRIDLVLCIFNATVTSRCDSPAQGAFTPCAQLLTK
jgi:hypothetical protein